MQGDDLRHVDWNIYGRLDALYLKLFQEQEELTVHLLVDASRSMSFGTPAKIDLACKLAAAIGYIAVMGFDRVAVEAFRTGDEAGMATQTLRPVRGRPGVRKLFSFIESVRADGVTELERACRSYALRNRSKGVVILFSDFLDPVGFEGALKRVQQIGGDAFAVHILSPDELDPTVSGDLRLVDSETMSHAEISVTPSLLKRYKKNVQGFCESIRRFCLARGIGYNLVRSDVPFERFVLEALRGGGLLR